MVEVPHMPEEPGRDVVDAVCEAQVPGFALLSSEQQDAVRNDAVSWLRAWRNQSVPVVPASPVRDRTLAVLAERDACASAIEAAASEAGEGPVAGALERLAERIRARPMDAERSALDPAAEIALRNEIAREYVSCYDGYRERSREWADGLFRHVDETGHHGDCGLVDRPAPYTCSACVIEEAYSFADGILAAVRPKESDPDTGEGVDAATARKRRLAREAREMRPLTSYYVTDAMADMAVDLLGDHFRARRGGQEMLRHIARRAIAGALRQLPLPLERIDEIRNLQYKVRNQRRELAILNDAKIELKQRFETLRGKLAAASEDPSSKTPESLGGVATVDG